MKNYKFILKTGVILLFCTTAYVSVKKSSNIIVEDNSLSTIEDLIKETNFKLDLKNINELEYTIQDSVVDIRNTGFNKSFSNNKKFNILTEDNGKISCINYISNLTDMSNEDVEYLHKIYSFIFGNLSSYMFDKTNETFKKVQSSDYINSNKFSILNQGYTQEYISLSKTSELKFTTYYENKHDGITAYKVSLDILQGNKW